MKVTLLSMFCFLLGFSAFAQKGDQFPDIKVSDLNENTLKIPDDTKGKYTLVGVAFSEKAQEDLYSWSQPVYNKFMNEDNFNSFVYDPYIKLIVMFGGGNQLVYKKAKKEITAGTDQSLKDNVVLYKGNIKDYRKELKMKDRKVPYFFVLDKKGKIIYTAKGRYSKKAIEEVAELIEL